LGALGLAPFGIRQCILGLGIKPAVAVQRVLSGLNDPYADIQFVAARSDGLDAGTVGTLHLGFRRVQ